MTSILEGKIFDMSDMHLSGSAFYQFLELRKRFFVDTLAWEIPHNDTVEMDQYDNPTATYSVAMRDGIVLGGARIMRFSDRWGSHGCMLGDAAKGLIDGIPETILRQTRSYDRASECTRLVLSDALKSTRDRQECLEIVVAGLVEAALRQGSEELVTLTVPALRRSLRKLGYDVEQISDTYVNSMDGRTYAVLRMPARHTETRKDMPTERPNVEYFPKRANV